MWKISRYLTPGLSILGDLGLESASDRSLNSNPTFRYNWIDGAERVEKYRPGCYHPIMISDVLHSRYRIVGKLGFMGYSTVWLARGSQSSQTRILWTLSEPGKSSSSSPVHLVWSAIPMPLHEFKFEGPNSTHRCYTMEPAQSNLREVSFSRLFPLDWQEAQVHFHQRDYLSYRHSSAQYGKPLRQNIPPIAVIPLYLGKNAEDFTLSDAQIIFSDFGEAFALDLQDRPGENCHTPLPMRPPEARFRPTRPLSYSEILGMKAIFSMEFVTVVEIVSQHIDVLGPMPLEWMDRWEERGNFFTDNEGQHRTEEREIWPPIDQSFTAGIQTYRRKHKMGKFGEDETAAIFDLMRRMFAFRPEERPSA
ncbi:hypothetical protein BJY01DRAFT_238750 [Aspergillus pseudoustus]|uniref:non-specific serine/threonine protein kinase n=1 Tax=Aspergillus pseudoustus TaxID=1810923 RepID=A0ABR4J6D2_9EURO